MATSGSSTAERGNDEFKQNIQKAYEKLKTSLTKFEVTKITDKLYSHSIILTEEREHIQRFSTDTESAQALCNIILKKDEFACEIFLKALHEIQRDDLVDLIWKEASAPDKQRFYAQLEKRIKDRQDLAKTQKEEHEMQLEQLKNKEDQQHQQAILDEKEKSLMLLQEYGLRNPQK